MSISPNLVKAREILANYPERLRKGEVPAPQCQRETYANQLVVSVNALLGTRPNLTQSKLIAEIIYTAFQLGCKTDDDANNMVLCSSDETPIGPPDADEIA